MTLDARIDNFLTKKFDRYPELQADIDKLLSASFRER